MFTLAPVPQSTKLQDVRVSWLVFVQTMDSTDAGYDFNVMDIIGVEIYRDATTAPAEWRQTLPQRCALIQFWSKWAW